MTIHIHELEIDVIIGILEHERDTTQRLLIDIKASYNYTQEDSFLDYAKMVNIVTNELQTKQYGLLENALIGLKNRIYHEFSQLDMLFIKLTKPDILSNCHVGVSQKWIF